MKEKLIGSNLSDKKWEDKVMDDKKVLDKMLSLIEEITKLKMENGRLKVELKHERELNKFRAEFPNSL